MNRLDPVDIRGAKKRRVAYCPGKDCKKMRPIVDVTPVGSIHHEWRCGVCKERLFTYDVVDVADDAEE
nr:hypothetical protein [Candidatus Sigynarchaeota archaeon]